MLKRTKRSTVWKFSSKEKASRYRESKRLLSEVRVGISSIVGRYDECGDLLLDALRAERELEERITRLLDEAEMSTRIKEEHGD